MSCRPYQDLSTITSATLPPPVLLLLDAILETLRYQQLFLHTKTDPSSDLLDIIQGMTLSQCSRSMYGLLRLPHTASISVLSLKTNLVHRIEECLKNKYGASTHAHKKDISSISELLELQRVLNLSVFLNNKVSESRGVVREVQHQLNTDKALALNGNVTRLREWVNEFVKESAVIVRATETSDNSVLERRFRTAIITQLKAKEQDSESPYRVELTSNTNSQGFDVDMIITFKQNEKEFVYNLEIDGPHHNKPHKEQFFRLRDSFLTEGGHVNYVRRVCLFGNDPRRMQVINKRARAAVVQRELLHMFNKVDSFFAMDAATATRSTD